MADAAAFAAAGLLDGLEDPRAREDRVALLQELHEDGVSMEELAEATRTKRLALLPVERILNRGDARYSALDIAERTGIHVDTLRRLWRALGLADTGDDDVAFTEQDLEAAKAVGQFTAGGLGEEPLARISQTLGQNMSRIAETLLEVVGEELLRAGDSERTLGLRYAQAMEQLVPLLNPLLGYILAVHMREQIKTDVISETELATGRLAGAREVSVCFADLVGFTWFGERATPAELSAAGQRLNDMAMAVAKPPVRLVKMIGDAAMLVSPEPASLVQAALELLDQAEEHKRAIPPLRAGIASGEAVPSTGDWYGAPVNLASRITDVARQSSVVVSRPVHEAVEDSFSWSYIGTRRFKGIRSEVPLYRARRL